MGEIKKEKLKSGLFFAFASVFLAVVIALLCLLFTSYMVRPVSVQLKQDVSYVFSDGETTYFGETDGTIERIVSGTDSPEEFGSAGSKIVLMEKFGDRLAAATEDRRILLFDEEGATVAEASINYNPSAIYAAQDRLFIAGSTNVSRNRVYCFDENLNFIDMTEGVAHEAQGENESDRIYNERINTLFLDVPITAIGYAREQLYVLSAYGIINTYDAQGELTDAIGMEYNPIAGEFMQDGRFIVLDDAGGLGMYGADLNTVFYLEGINASNKALAVNGQRIILSDINGRLTEVDFTGNILLQQTLQGKIEGIYLDAQDRFSIWNESSAEVSVYDWADMGHYTAAVVLAYVGIVVLLVALAIEVLAVLKLVSLRKYRTVQKVLKNTGKKLYFGKIAYLLLLPTLVLSILFAYYPAIQGFGLAFFEVDIGGVNTFVGWKNFQDLMAKTYFWSGMGNMVIFLVTDLLKGLIPAFIFAELIVAMRSSKAQYVTRVLLYLPGIIPGVASLLMWQTGIFGNEGLLNGIVTAFGGEPVNFLGQEGTALTSLIFFGFPWIGSYIILYGSLIGVPQSFYDAAKLDGCTWGKRLLFIDLPLISPQLKYIFVITFIGSIQDFQRIYLTTEGAAGTYVPMLEMYYNLTRFDNLGMAAAMGLILFLILMIATLINLKLKTVDSYE